MVNARRIMMALAILTPCIWTPHTFALTSFSLERSTPDGILQSAFYKDGENWFYSQNTNFFNKTSMKLGVFEVSNQKDIAPSIKLLESIESGISSTARTLGKNLPPKSNPGHDNYFKIDENLITSNDPLYEKANQVFEAMYFNAKLTHYNGIELSLEKAPIKKVIKKKSKFSEERFNANFECSRRENYRFCNIENYGTLYIPNK